MGKFDKDKIWHEVLDSIKVSVSSAIFSTWLSQTHLVSLKKVSDQRYLAEIGCNSYFVKTTVEKRYFGLIQDCLIKILEIPCDLEFSVKQSPDAKLNSKPTLAPLFQEEEDKNEILTAKLTQSKVRPGFSFENFAVSASNQMAWAATQAVAQKPGIAYNPLFIWGGVGVGKTHLMQAVGYSIIKGNLDAKVLACTAEEFTNDIVEGIRNKTTQGFRDKYRKLKALFIDDIQFIAGKDAVQDEFFHTFNAVTGAGGQIVMTADKPPNEITKLEARLLSRFQAGLVVDIAPPDFELRCAIIQIKCQEKGIELENSLVQLIAGNITTARELEGFLIRLTSEAKLKNVLITEELVKTLLSKGAGQLEETKKAVTPDKVIDAVSSHFSINKKVLVGSQRARIIVRPRQILMYLLRKELGLPLQEVGRLTGGRDHSTVMHAVQTITHLASENVKIREDLVGIKNSL